jgi:hypothetical protein
MPFVRTLIHPPLVRSLLAILASGIPTAGMADCAVQSGPGTAALVELYTSEGCSSCPLADRQLGQLRQDAKLVPLALHVGYWDALGWPDPYARDDFARRQSWLVQLAGRRTVYTPQFFVGGNEARPAAVADEVRRLNGQPAQADIRLQAQTMGGDVLSISATASSAIDGAALYVAVAENGLSTQVRAGENAGRKLGHEHVVRAWIGPLKLQGGSVEFRRSVPLDRTWQRGRLEVSAFVQDPHDGRVLQAVGAGQCLGS